MAEATSNIPVGFCQCGCGLQTRVPTRNHRSNRGYHEFSGVPLRFVKGHANKVKHNPNQYHEEDTGYSSPCWLWHGRLHERGYAHVYIPEAGKHRYMHVVLYERKYGTVPAGLELDHLCRVRRCVNPDHLEPVTHAENGRRGLLAKLTRDDVEEIKRRWAAGGVTKRGLGREFGCTCANIRIILAGKSWVKP
jgi:hypothetical protein